MSRLASKPTRTPVDRNEADDRQTMTLVASLSLVYI